MAPEEKEIKLKQIRTFQGDVAEALKQQQESLVSIQRAEQKKTFTAPRPQPSPDAKRRRQYFILTVASLLLFGLGAGGVWFAYGEFQKRTVTKVEQVPSNRFITASASEEINVSSSTREMLINEVAAAGTASAANEVAHIDLVKNDGLGEAKISSEEFLNILRSQASGSLMRALEDQFMLGSLDGSRFIIFRLASYDNAFAGMLSWERFMAQDIGPLFATAPLLRDVPFGSTFEDLTDRNKDIRVLRTQGDQDVIMYSFFESNSLVITDSLESMRTILDRLSRERLSR